MKMPRITKRHRDKANELKRKQAECNELYTIARPLNMKIADLRGQYFTALEDLCEEFKIPNYGEIGELDKFNALRELGFNI